MSCLSLNTLAEALSSDAPETWGDLSDISQPGGGDSGLPGVLSVVVPTESSPEYDVLAEGLSLLNPGQIVPRADAQVAGSSSDVVSAVSSVQGALGFVPPGTVLGSDQVRFVDMLLPAMGCVRIDASTLESGDYPFAEPVFVHVVGDDDAAEFARYAIDSFAPVIAGS